MVKFLRFMVNLHEFYFKTSKKCQKVYEHRDNEYKYSELLYLHNSTFKKTKINTIDTFR